MGEIRVKVKLANALDESLSRRGQLRPEDVRRWEADALVDTGAVRTVLPQAVLDQLGLCVRGYRSAELADGRTESVPVSEPVVIDILGRDTLDEAFVLGNDILIGQTVLEKLDLLADCARQRLIPNPAHPDGPVNRI